MDPNTVETLEIAREIDDLNLTIKNQQMQLDFRDQQLRTLRVRVNRYERILGMEAAA
jgi:cell division protein FtsL